VPKFYWTVASANAFRAGIDSLGPEDVRPDWIWPPPGVSYGFPDDRITAVVDAAEHLPAKVAAIGAQATQMALGPTGRAFTLSNNVILPVLSQEHYLLISGRPGATDDKGWEHDLLAGIDFTAE
jgi:N-acetyl-1-D-myo-inositol-2-amino-2-deoxy-alpha-D-glucopyranoside deacetylase